MNLLFQDELELMEKSSSVKLGMYKGLCDSPDRNKMIIFDLQG